MARNRRNRGPNGTVSLGTHGPGSTWSLRGDNAETNDVTGRQDVLPVFIDVDRRAAGYRHRVPFE